MNKLPLIGNGSNLEVSNIKTRHSTLSCEDKAENLVLHSSTTEMVFVINCDAEDDVAAILQVQLFILYTDLDHFI